MIEIKHINDRFIIGPQDQPEAYAEVELKEGVLTILHTVVSPDHQGKGLASQLIEAIVDQARKQRWMIQPQCEYAKAQFEKKPQYQDVWAK